jgi:CRISPR/Cas system CMR-associated protein Cmr5 small subunit
MAVGTTFLNFLASAKELVTKQKQIFGKYNPFMTIRILSMDEQLLPTIATIQSKIQFLSEARQQSLLFNVLPKQSNFNIKYISKGKLKGVKSHVI